MSWRLFYPWFLAAAPLVALVWWAWLDRRRRASIRFSSVAPLLPGTRTWRVRARRILPVLRTLAVLLLVLAIARPQRADEQTKVQTEGIAVQLVVDRSGSMEQADFRDDRGQPQSRLQVVKDVVRSFIAGEGRGLPGRSGDLIGLTSFARFADTDCPLTRDHKHLIRALDEVSVPRSRTEDGTAIGDALMLAVERIRNIGRKLAKGEAFTVKSRVIILLTDGEQNAGEFIPQEAADVAASLGIKIYTIGAAPDFQQRSIGGGLFMDPQTLRVPVAIDEAMLQKVADKTGGKYFRARDEQSLKQIYQEIDKLERTVIDEQRFQVWEDLATNWVRLGRVSLPPVLMLALGLLAVEQALAFTVFRRIP